MTAAALEIEAHDLRTAPEEALRALHAHDVAFEEESRPDDPPTPWETFLSRCRSMPNYRDATVWVAWDNGEAVGNAVADFDRTGSNAHVVEAFITVPPAHRQKGIARRLLAEVVAAAEGEARTLLLGYTTSSIPAGAAFMKRLGAAAGLEERESELTLADLDLELLRGWVDEGPARAPDYELLTIEEELPEELLEGFAALYDASNDAPRDGLAIEDSHRTPEQIREKDRSARASGTERILCVARHRTSSDLAGWTELARHPAQPWKVQQYWTAVHPAHRGHALGKWLKAAAALRAVERWPDATKIVTGNAYSNDAMLGINNTMGFRETDAWTVWQVPVAELRSYAGGA